MLKYSDLFRHECVARFGIRPSHVENAVAHPDRTHIDRFGVQIRVGAETGKLILQQKVSMNSDGEIAVVQSSERPESVLVQAFVKMTEENGFRVANCVLVYALDTARYREYLALPR